MPITQRQEFILDKIIREYIKTAKPVSSGLIEEKYHPDVKPATIRRDFAQLDEAGFTWQPHASSGRIPTDRGYRLFVEHLFEQELKSSGSLEKIIKELQELRKNLADQMQFFSQLAKVLSRASSNLVFSYVVEDFYITDGWPQVIKEPEFKSSKTLRHFVLMVQELQDRADSFVQDLSQKPAVKILIGKESKIPHSENFSIIMTGGRIKKEPGLIALVGPKRMNYSKNIKLMRLTLELLS